MSLTVGSLFAGIGGFDLGFTRAGCDVRWQVEIDPWCRRVLERHFPAARRYEDVREVGSHNLEWVDVVCGGFPCQDISNAGQRAGIEGERSGLWREMWRIVGELRPRYLVVENVAALLGRGMERVIGDLAEIGYDAEWDVISAADVGAPHLRERIWIIAYPSGIGCHDGSHSRQERHLLPNFHGDAAQGEPEWSGRVSGIGTTGTATAGTLADPQGDLRRTPRHDRPQPLDGSRASAIAGMGGSLCYTPSAGFPDWAGGEVGQPRPLTEFERPDGREIERDFRGVATRVSRRVDRLRGLGNAVVPQIPELIARRILAAEGQ